MRRKDKEEGRGLGEGSHLVFENSARGGRGGENGDNRLFWELSQGTVVGNFELGGEKP
jgi:hypothetical protein